MADEIQHRQAEDKMCWEKSLSAKKPHRLEGGQILEELIRTEKISLKHPAQCRWQVHREQGSK